MDVCSHIHVLDFGEIIAVGSPEEIRVNDAVLAAYLGTPVEPTA
jgi:branched-chain amino acid transport system ATP-binding protein